MKTSELDTIKVGQIFKDEENNKFIKITEKFKGTENYSGYLMYDVLGDDFGYDRRMHIASTTFYKLKRSTKEDYFLECI